MESLEGIPSLKESKYMESARSRNRKVQADLNHSLQEFTKALQRKTSTINTERRFLMKAMQDRDPNNKKPLIIPRGLSERENQIYRMLNCRWVPSMTLDAFDQKLKEIQCVDRADTKGNKDTSVFGKDSKSSSLPVLTRRNQRDILHRACDENIFNSTLYRTINCKSERKSKNESKSTAKLHSGLNKLPDLFTRENIQNNRGSNQNQFKNGNSLPIVTDKRNQTDSIGNNVKLSTKGKVSMLPPIGHME